MSKFNLDDLDDEPPKCPHKSCEEYGNRNDCYTHAHVICPIFDDWYDNLTREQLRHLYLSNRNI